MEEHLTFNQVVGSSSLLTFTAENQQNNKIFRVVYFKDYIGIRLMGRLLTFNQIIAGSIPAFKYIFFEAFLPNF